MVHAPVSLYGVTDPELQRWAEERCVAQPWRCFEEPSALTGAWTTVAVKVYIRCTQTPLDYLDSFAGWAGQESGWNLHRLASGHDCMITEPEGLAEILLSYAA